MSCGKKKGCANQGRLDIGCVASHGHFFGDGPGGAYEFVNEGKPATAFLFKLIAQLQFSGTVPMIDVDAYAEWLAQRPVAEASVTTRRCHLSSGPTGRSFVVAFKAAPMP